MSTILPCPFCCEVPSVPDVDDVFGASCYIECKCGMSISVVCIRDLMTIEEREKVIVDSLNFYQQLEYRQRALDYCIKKWNTRA